MKIYLDDERSLPMGWTFALNPASVIYHLEHQNCHKEANKLSRVTHVSLDHDLGCSAFDVPYECNGYDVLLWIEEKVASGDFFVLPELTVHTANVSARVKMEAAVIKIKELYNEKTTS